MGARRGHAGIRAAADRARTDDDRRLFSSKLWIASSNIEIAALDADQGIPRRYRRESPEDGSRRCRSLSRASEHTHFEGKTAGRRVSLLRPDGQMFTAMLDGRRNQELARNLAFSMINSREKMVRVHLARRGVPVGVEFVWRLVTQTPERLSMSVLAALW
ncbi:hypothetical protein [Nocardia bovistercoris]|uniref:Uncharacterized protein n=1 Tax=Nocardia bovistercoris TaxID=2785916 RepID=A0A931N6G8_9NOCA|nr:hypothetical protein [Nocardia bovistercoris]MBH0780501.1 hypothetical protein [Nocardia bovistercoris]